MNRAQAEQRIQQIFGNYTNLQPADNALLQQLNDGKLYELFVLSHVVENLVQRGYQLNFRPNAQHPSVLQFKAAPGALKSSDSHFEVISPGGELYWLFVDIEFDTLGHAENSANDRSRRHEIDIMVCSVNVGHPRHDQIALGVECKAWANFTKGLVKEALGVRRELCFLQSERDSMLSADPGVLQKVTVPAEPPSEFWLAFIDQGGTNYSQSPAVYGIELKHLQP